MKQIFTKTGDEGMTSLREGVRVPKDDPRIEANGQTDHLNSLLGVVRAMLTEQMEQAIAQHRPDNIPFVIPGDSSTLSAFIHLARTQSRTVERRLWTLHRQHPVDHGVLVMMNRLSDYLFVLASHYV